MQRAGNGPGLGSRDLKLFESATGGILIDDGVRSIGCQRDRTDLGYQGYPTKSQNIQLHMQKTSLRAWCCRFQFFMTVVVEYVV